MDASAAVLILCFHGTALSLEVMITTLELSCLQPCSLLQEFLLCSLIIILLLYFDLSGVHGSDNSGHVSDNSGLWLYPTDNLSSMDQLHQWRFKLFLDLSSIVIPTKLPLSM